MTHFQSLCQSIEHASRPETQRPGTTNRVLTYSAASTMLTCPQQFQYRYEEGLSPVVKAHALWFGGVSHQWLEGWHKTGSISECQETIDASYPNRAADANQKQDWHHQTAMLKAYTEQYAQEEFHALWLEREFSGPLRNPATGRPSRSFSVRGKVDGIVLRNGRYYLLEHKTADTLTGNYIERLSMDLQILMYSHYVRESLGCPVEGILYNVLVKPRLVQSEGETEEQFEARRAELQAKSKTGKPSTAKRKLPETDEEFQERLAAWFAAEPRFLRVELFLDFDAVNNVLQMLWDISKSILDARRCGRWHQNPRACFGFGRCAYWPICSSKGNELVIENLYTKTRPHEELSREEESDPAF